MNVSVDRPCTVRIEPYGKIVQTVEGRTLLEICLEEGIRMDAGCAGRGTCGKCRVVVLEGEVEGGVSAAISPEDRARGTRLACMSRIKGDSLVVEVPASSVKPKEVFSSPATEAASCRPFRPDEFSPHEFWSQGPICTRVTVSMTPPTLDDPVTDYDRLINAIRALPGCPSQFRASIDVLGELGSVLRESNWRADAWISAMDCIPAILNVEGARPGVDNYGVAVDIGTTSLSACLCDLSTLTPKAFARCLNSQAIHGADVITRILFGSTPEGLGELKDLVLEDVNSLVDALCQVAGIEPDLITGMQCAGNTTMTQIALGVDPSHIRKEPYVATANVFPPMRAEGLGLRINPRGVVNFMPCVASYVGGDITAGVLATGIARSDEISLLIDMGTNGEIVLGGSEWLVCCSCSVGPAFEGSGITSGMLAEPGAIDDITVTEKGVEYNTIGGGRPVGICGSGLIRAFSELLENGLIDRTAKLQPEAGHPAVRTNRDTLEFLVASTKDREIVITQPDLDNLLRSKAAVYAATVLLVKKMGIELGDVSRILVAGGFGSHIDFSDAVRIGLLPDLPLGVYSFAGNTSLTGARAGLGFLSAQEEVREISEKMTYIELSGDNAYHEEFVRACFLPHTDLDLFPSAGK
jgi:uncharacterized 2Fe-2S/4Fe-4S cluster protein (DUF4445 family)